MGHVLGEWAVVPAGPGRDHGDPGIGEGVQCLGVRGAGGVCSEHERDGWLWGAIRAALSAAVIAPKTRAAVGIVISPSGDRR
ncbi:MAG: hypothetical protein ABIZ05_11390 [Pseudonocardiaceae bacterium]